MNDLSEKFDTIEHVVTLSCNMRAFIEHLLEHHAQSPAAEAFLLQTAVDIEQNTEHFLDNIDTETKEYCEILVEQGCAEHTNHYKQALTQINARLGANNENL